jgi:hypothetical protein
MEKKMKRTIFSKILMASVAALLAATFVSAGLPKGNCPQPKDICCDDAKPGPFAFSYAKDIGLACPRDFYFHADFLAMQPMEQGLDYAIRNDSTTVNNLVQGGDVIGFSDDHSNSWGWDLGFKIGIGAFLNHDAWKLDAEWMWLHVHEKSSLNLPAGTNNEWLIPLWLPANVQSVLTGKNNSADWQALYNTVDVSLGHPYHISRYLVADPFIGLRFGFIEQDYIVRYSRAYTAYAGDTSAAVESINVTNDNDYWGVGARAGLNTEWNLGAGVKLFGKFAASLLYGKFNVKQKTDLTTTNDAQADHEFYQILPNMDLAIGAAYGTFLSKRKYLMTISVAYEFHHWWQQNNMRQFNTKTANVGATTLFTGYSTPVARGDFSLGGLDVAVRFDF